jgi:hypothetical protein
VDIKKENVWTVIAIGVFLGLLLVSYVYKAQRTGNVNATLQTNSRCDLRKEHCMATLPSGETVFFSINPKSIPLLEPLTLEVKTKNADISSVMIDFEGVDMDMGSNQAKLTQVTRHQFTGKAILPVCSHQKMEWKANVLLTTKQGVISAPFHFYTLKDK